MKTLKQEILHAGGHTYDVAEHKAQVQEMTDEQLVDHRRSLLSSTKTDKIGTDEYWSKMWTINAEMAARFCRRVRG